MIAALRAILGIGSVQNGINVQTDKKLLPKPHLPKKSPIQVLWVSGHNKISDITRLGVDQPLVSTETPVEYPTRKLRYTSVCRNGKIITERE